MFNFNKDSIDVLTNKVIEILNQMEENKNKNRQFIYDYDNNIKKINELEKRIDDTRNLLTTLLKKLNYKHEVKWCDCNKSLIPVLTKKTK